MSLNISEYEIADAIWCGELDLPTIVRHLARECASDGDEASLLTEFSDIGKSLADVAWEPAFHHFGVALDQLATDHHEKLLKGDQA